MIDSKWLSEILRANVWQCGALTFASAIIVFSDTVGISVLAGLPNWAKPLAGIALITFGSLTLFALAQKATKRWQDAGRRLDRYARLVSQLQSLSDKEHEVLSYLVTRNEQYFEASLHGGGANTLIAKGIVVKAARPGDHVHILHFPFAVQDDVWTLPRGLEDEFSHPHPSGPPPWRDRR